MKPDYLRRVWDRLGRMKKFGPAALVILVLVAFYVLLGCVLETVSMILITVPVFLPLVVGLGYDPVWFGILIVVVAEMGLITPPVGFCGEQSARKDASLIKGRSSPAVGINAFSAFASTTTCSASTKCV